MINMRKYRDADGKTLISILKQNIPKYFAESDLPDFKENLLKKKWTNHYVYLNNDGRIIGCAGFYLKSDVIGLAYMFFEPSQVGPSAIRPELAKYISLAMTELCPQGKPTLILNTTPRVAAILKRFGFIITDMVKDGYAKGYDLVNMKKPTSSK